jgi:hypothetical protein
MKPLQKHLSLFSTEFLELSDSEWEFLFGLCPLLWVDGPTADGGMALNGIICALLTIQ